MVGVYIGRKKAVFLLYQQQEHATGKPSYLAELVHTHTPARAFRSSLRRPNQLHVPTSELHSVAAPFVMLRQQCGTACRRKSLILCFHSKHSSLGWKHICTINRSAVDRVTDPHLRFDVSERRHMMCDELCIIIIIITTLQVVIIKCY